MSLCLSILDGAILYLTGKYKQLDDEDALREDASKRTAGNSGVRVVVCLLLLLAASYESGCGETKTIINPSVQIAPATQTLMPASYFGMSVGYPDMEIWPAVPLSTIHLWDSAVNWIDLEPNPGEWHFDRLDEIVSLAALHNADVLLPLALSPTWASSQPTQVCVYNVYGCTAPPASMVDWTNYVDTVAQRYKGRIRYYEIWNEVNLQEFWTGTPQDLIMLQQIAYTEIKRIDPAAQVLSPSVAGGTGPAYLASLLQIGLANSADIMNFHLYVTPQVPELVVVRANEFNTVLAQYNVTKPAWNTETNWLDPLVLSDQLGAAYLMRAMLAATSAGISRFLWYQWDNHCCVSIQMTDSSNLVLTPAAHAFARLQTWVVGNQMEGCSSGTEGVWTCKLLLANGLQGAIIWAPGESVQLTTMSGFTPHTVEDMNGNVTSWAGQVTVNDFPVLVE